MRPASILRLQLGFYDVLRVGEEPAGKAADASSQELLVQSWCWICCRWSLRSQAEEQVLGDLVGSELERVGWDLSADGWHQSFEDPACDSLFDVYFLQAVNWSFIICIALVLGLQLQPTFHQLDWRKHE